MRQTEALEHVAHNRGSLYVMDGWRGHKYLYCGEHSVTIGMPMLNRLLERNDLEMIPNTFTYGYSAILTDQGKARI